MEDDRIVKLLASIDRSLLWIGAALGVIIGLLLTFLLIWIVRGL
jgi:hypothetical protein